MYGKSQGVVLKKKRLSFFGLWVYMKSCYTVLLYV